MDIKRELEDLLKQFQLIQDKYEDLMEKEPIATWKSYHNGVQNGMLIAEAKVQGLLDRLRNEK